MKAVVWHLNNGNFVLPETPARKYVFPYTILDNFASISIAYRQFKCYIWSIALYGAETWTLRKLDQK
jgi:hypothetical protein